MSGLPTDVHQISLRTWRSATEVTALTTPIRCRPAPKPDDVGPPEEQGDPPYMTLTAYAVNITTDKAREIAAYTAQSFFSIVLWPRRGALTRSLTGRWVVLADIDIP
ncbi:hypothetical protein AB0J63_17920 [Streptosporangium canum]|uniref:hypothetical protein n=1 Tax=Streptosporangium canum TaxID=324952 RepID=UPI003442238D